MTLCLRLEMSLSKEVLWAQSLSSETTLMTGNQGGQACLSDRNPEGERACGSLRLVPICQDGSVDCDMCLGPPGLLQ